jgi:hypothetical protein
VHEGRHYIVSQQLYTVTKPDASYLWLGGADNNLCLQGSSADLHTGIASVCELTSEQLVDLSKHNTIRDELSLLGDTSGCTGRANVS